MSDASDTLALYQKLAQDPDVRKVLDTVSAAEGTDKNGYATAFGGGKLDSLDDHPRKAYDFTQSDGKPNKTTAAGRYQFLQGTWDDVAGKLGLPDFSPQNQDIAAVELLNRAGALEPALRGDYKTALQKSGTTWASLPSSPYAQPKRSPGFIEKALNAVIPAANAGEVPVNDLSKLSDEDLMKALQSQQQPAAPDLSAMSDADLMKALGTPGVEDSTGLKGLGAGLGKGVGTVVLNAQRYIGKGLQGLGADTAGNWLENDATQGLQNLDSQVAPYREASPFMTGAGELGGEVAATLPVGGILGKAVGSAAPILGRAAPATQKLAEALRTGGMNLGGAPATSFAGSIGNGLLRTAGGAGTGAAAASLIDPDSAGVGGIVGGAMPGALGLVGKAGSAASSLLRPFTESGQGRIAGQALRDFATDPAAAVGQLQGSNALIPGSMPTTAMAAGDTGLASLSRAMQNADPRYAAELQTRMTAQNQARTSAVENVAGNTGKLDIAKQARDALTAPMRESVLDAAGQVPADAVLKPIDRLLKDPNNAGKLAQQALGEIRGRIAQFAPDGNIDARALYAIRKDINETLSGKLQGEAGNLKYASGQLISVKNAIDDAIDLASRRVPSTGTDLMPYGANVSRTNVPNSASSQGPRSTWKEYLKTYADESIPIGQMQKLDEVLKKIQNGTVDTQGGAMLSAPKLNNILKNEGPELEKTLAPAHMDLLRKLAADLNASQIAQNAGRSVGSNTLQNMAQNNILSAALGKKVGGSSLLQTTLGRALQIPYGTANKRIQEQLGNALLNPQTAAQIMSDPGNARLVQMLQQLGAGTSKATPAISSAIAPIFND